MREADDSQIPPMFNEESYCSVSLYFSCLILVFSCIFERGNIFLFIIEFLQLLDEDNTGKMISSES